MGASDLRIMALHILPNIMQVLLPSITIGFNNAILSEASMSFLGLGIQPPEASLGSMLSDSQTYLLSSPMVCPVHRRHHGSADSGLQYAG